MKFNKVFLILPLSLALISCNGGTGNTSSSTSSSSNGIDYSLFDESIIGTWYVHQSMMGLANINDVILINDNYTASFLGVNFSFIGLYEGFEDTCLFKSEKGTVDFVVSYDGEGNIDWAIADIVGNQDWGYAGSEEHISGIRYSYEGTSWPMDKINEFLETEGNIPVFEHDYYYLYTGTSQIYEDLYCMIDLFGVDEDARDNYTSKLENEGYIFFKDDPTFYTGYDASHTFAIRLKQYEDNLSIFVYYYHTFYSTI